MTNQHKTFYHAIYKKNNYRSRYGRSKHRNKIISLNYNKLNKIFKSMRVYNNKLTNPLFEDKSYLDTNLSMILSDIDFKSKIKEIEELYKNYFNEVEINYELIENNFNDYCFNSKGYSNSEEKFYDEITKLKKKYYFFQMIKHIYIKGNINREIEFKNILLDKNFINLFNYSELEIQAKIFMKNVFSWSEFDLQNEAIGSKLKKNIDLNSDEKKIIEISVIVKKLYLFHLKLEQNINFYKKNYINFTSIIKDSDYIKKINFASIERKGRI